VCDGGTLDLCGGAPCTTLTGATFTGMFEEVEDDYEPTCGRAGGRDAAYTFTLDAPKDVTITASTGSFGSTYLVLTTDCATGEATLRCETSWWGGTAEIQHRELPPGTYFVLVESDDSSASMWSM